jgi:CheY-like chemotaxis protein
LVLLDLKMPKMSGWEALDRIRRLAPEIPVILTSGYAMDEEHGEARLRGARALLPKPYRAQTLLTAVGESLDANARAKTHRELGRRTGEVPAPE